MSETINAGTAEGAQDANKGPVEQGVPESQAAPPEAEKVEGAEVKPEDGAPEGNDPRESDAGDLPEWARNERSRLRSEAAEWRRKFRDLEESTKDVKTPQEFEDAVSKFKDQINQLQGQVLARDVCDEYNIPKQLRVFVTGDTREEMVEKAKLLVAPSSDPAGGVEPTGGLAPDADAEGDFSDPVKAVQSLLSRQNHF